jgi:hypothetical protein
MPKQMTDRQLAANRANARKSTGPRTRAGKERVRYNALTHGLLARAVIPSVLEPYESRQEYGCLLQSLRDEHLPETPTEHLLVESIAASYWRLKHLYRTEAGLIARRRDANATEGSFGVPEPHPALARLRDSLADPAALRALLVVPGSGREGYTDSQVLELAQGIIATLEREHAQAIARWREVADSEASLPRPETVQRLGRYEAQLNRHIHSAMRTLRELRASRTTRRSPEEILAPDQPTQEVP